MDEAYADEGTLLPKDCFAIVLTRDGECSMCVPKMGDKDVMPDSWVAATMVGIKFMRDHEWVQDLIDEFGEARNS